MTPLRRAAIAFSELLSDYVPTEIVDILHDHHYLTRDTAFLARCYSKLELEELGEIEKVIESFFEEVANESILEENLTDWQREIIAAINQVIDNSIFSGLFSVRNTLTVYDDIEIAIISIESADNKGLLINVMDHFCQLNQEVRSSYIRSFIRKLLKGEFTEGDLLESLLPWQQGIVAAINSITFLESFDLSYLDLHAVLLNDNDSSVEGDYKKVEEYSELGSLARFYKAEKYYVKDLASDLVRLSFISHALGIELLYSKPVSMAYYLNKRINLLYDKIHEDEIRIADFTNEQDASQGLASMASVTRFVNRNSKRVIKEIKDDHIDSPIKKGTNGFPDHKQYTYKSVTSFDAKVDEVSRRVGSAVEVKSTHKVTGSKNTREHVTQIDPNSDRDVNYDEICRFLNDLESRDIKTASLIRQILQNDFSSISGNESLSKTDIYQLVSITYLLFVCEASKNPAAFIHHQMLLDLVFYEHISWNQMFGISYQTNPLMPMRPKGSIMEARKLNELYKEYLPIKYQFDSRCGEGTADLLIKRESKLVKKWLEKVKEIDSSVLSVIKTKEIINLIKASMIDWYGVDLSIDIEEEYYTEDQMIALLGHYLPSHDYTVMPQTQFEHADLLRENLRLAIRDANDGSPAIIPINLHHNHWAGLLIRRQADGRIEVIHIDPLGNTLEDEPNYQLFMQTIQEFAPGAHIVDLGTQHFVQQHNGHDCGPFTVDNLRRLAEAGDQLDNLNAEQIIALGILSQPENGSANHLRNLYELILNPQLNSSTATNAEVESNNVLTYEEYSSLVTEDSLSADGLAGISALLLLLGLEMYGSH